MTDALEKWRNYHIMKQRRSDLEWQELIQECNSSGLSIKDWCAEKEIPANTFYYHVRRLRKEKESPSQPVTKNSGLVTEVVPLMFKDERLTAQEPGDGSLTVSRGLMLHCRNIHVSIPEQTSLPLICNVIKALQDLC